MNRRRTTAIASVACAVLLSACGGESSYRVSAVFDTAKGLVPGQNVKIAGTRVGKVRSVDLLDRGNGSFKARVGLEIEQRFQPFRADASCRILPEGLISENFIDCDPGAAVKAPLKEIDGEPTVALRRTTVPASLQDVLDTFPLDTTQRLTILLNELGIMSAGNGENLNALLRRANPALTKANRALGILADQRQALADSIRSTDAILTSVSRRDENLTRFIDRAAAVAETSAAREDELGEAIESLPPLLDGLNASLPRVREFARDSTPLIRQLRNAAPEIEELGAAIPPFTSAGIPASEALAGAAKAGREAVPSAEVVGSSLRKLAVDARPMAERLRRLLINSRDRGAIEGLIDSWRPIALATSAYDDVSHQVLVVALAIAHCYVSNADPSTPKIPGCSHTYDQPNNGQIPLTLAPPTGYFTGEQPQRKHLKRLLDYMIG